MSKTMYVPKGETVLLDNLTCEQVIVNGVLHVIGDIQAKHIRGKGFIFAGNISTKSITACTINAGTIVTDRLVAERVTAVKLHAVQAAAVSSYLEADLVKSPKITVADANIADLIAEEVVQLKTRRRGLLGTLFASFVRSLWTALVYGSPRDHEADEPDTVEDEDDDNEDAEYTAIEGSAPMNTPLHITDAEALTHDPEFVRLKSMYQLTRDRGYIWQLVPNPLGLDKAVTMAEHPFATVEEPEVAA